jgi:hypothetical protein
LRFSYGIRFTRVCRGSRLVLCHFREVILRNLLHFVRRLVVDFHFASPEVERALTFAFVDICESEIFFRVARGLFVWCFVHVYIKGGFQ